MALFHKPSPGSRKVLWILSGGFALVVLLLGLAAYLAARDSARIQASSANLIADHLKTARLIDAVEAEQQKMDRLLFELSRGRKAPPSKEEVVRKLAETKAAVEEAVKLKPPAAASATWRELGLASRQFTESATAIAGQPESDERQLQSLLRKHESFVQLVGQLVKEDAERSIAIERDIETQSRQLSSEGTWVLGLCFVLALAFAVLTVAYADQTIQQMNRQAYELNQVSWHMLQGQEAAARRFSHELHDELGQSLAGLKAMLGNAAAANKGPECMQLVDEAIRNVRELSQLLRPVILDDFGLDSALRWLVEGFSQRTGIEIEYSAHPGSERLADETETHLFRITQEALTNVARHSGASRAIIGLAETAGAVRLMVEDNGRGLSEGDRASVGLVGMRARAVQAGGSLAISRGDLGGMKILVEVPARRRALQNADTENTNLIG